MILHHWIIFLSLYLLIGFLFVSFIHLYGKALEDDVKVSLMFVIFWPIMILVELLIDVIILAKKYLKWLDSQKYKKEKRLRAIKEIK